MLGGSIVGKDPVRKTRLAVVIVLVGHVQPLIGSHTWAHHKEVDGLSPTYLDQLILLPCTRIIWY